MPLSPAITERLEAFEQSSPEQITQNREALLHDIESMQASDELKAMEEWITERLNVIAATRTQLQEAQHDVAKQLQVTAAEAALRAVQQRAHQRRQELEPGFTTHAKNYVTSFSNTAMQLTDKMSESAAWRWGILGLAGAKLLDLLSAPFRRTYAAGRDAIVGPPKPVATPLLPGKPTIGSTILNALKIGLIFLVGSTAVKAMSGTKKTS